MIAVWMLAAAAALQWPSGADVERVAITSSLAALWPPDAYAKWCALPGASCTPSTHSMSYTFARNMQGATGNLPIKEDLLDALMSEARKPVPIPSATLLGLTSKQIKSLCRTPQKSDLAMLQHYFDQRYYFTDSEPSVTAELELANGQTLKLESATQAIYALPWTITLNNKAFKSYNPKLSEALAKFLSADDMNRDFLNGGGVPFGGGTFEYGCR